MHREKMRLLAVILCFMMSITMFPANPAAVYAEQGPAGAELQKTAADPLYVIQDDTTPGAVDPLYTITPDSAAPVISITYGVTLTHPWITTANLGSGGAPGKVHAYFTVDGTSPTNASPEVTFTTFTWGGRTYIFSNFPELPTALSLLKVIVYLDGDQGGRPLVSDVGAALINTGAMKLSKASGLYTTSDLAAGITMSGVGTGAVIYYTTGTGPYSVENGIADTSSIPSPTTGSAVYAGTPIPVGGTDAANCFIIKAAAHFESGGKHYWSNVVTGYYRSSDTLPQLSKDTINEVLNALSLDERIALTSGIGGDPTSLINGKNIPDEIGFSTAPDRYELGNKVQGGGPAGGTLAIPRFNIPAMVLADGPAGLRMWKNATVWMAPAGLGSTWNTDIMNDIGERVSKEANYYAVDIVLGPGLNTQRNPLAGRNFEYYSEDPYITGNSAAAYVGSIQKGGVGVSLKHYAANDSESNRSQGDVVVSERALREIYLRGFEMAAAEKPWTYMAAYNKVNGTVAASNKWLMTDVLRGDWDFDGFVMSDWGADYAPTDSLEAQMDLGESSRNTTTVFNWINAANIDQAEKSRRIGLVNRSVKNILGVIVRSAAFNGVYGELQPDGTYSELTQTEVSERSNTWESSPVRIASAEVNKQAADEAIVMLKNAGGELGKALPLEPGAKLALVTSHLAWNEMYHGRWYNASASVGDIVIEGTGSAQVRFNKPGDYSPTLEKALESRGFEVVDHRVDSKMNMTYDELLRIGRRIGDPIPPQVGQVESLPVTTNDANTKAAATAAASAADVGVFVLTRVSGEGADLAPADFNLTDREKAVFKAYADAFHAKGKKIVVLLNVGGTINTTEFRADADAILDVWNPGTEGTVAIADILKGAVNPSGKLAQTFPNTYEDSPSIAMAKPGHEGKTFNSSPTVYYDDGVYVGYRYYETHPEKYATMVAYPFGYGLSYTNFDYSDLTLDKATFNGEDDTITASVKVTNIGSVAGKEVVQLYLSASTWQDENRPKQELRAYGKTGLLEPGESEIVPLTLKLRDLQYFDDGNPDNDLSKKVAYGKGNGWVVENNTEFTVTVRNNSAAAENPNVPIQGLTQTFTYNPGPNQQVSIPDVAGVTPPVSGAAPVTTVTATRQFKGTVSWDPADSTFGGNKVYTATISLTPKTGYTFEGVAADSFKVAGATSVTNAAGSGIITAVFPATASSPVNLLDIPGIAAPVTGAAPAIAVETAQYTGTIVWTPAAGNFAAGTAYTATINLTPKDGYTLAGVAANSFRVAGATSTSNAAGSGIVTAVFPATASGGGHGGGFGSSKVTTPAPKWTCENPSGAEADLPKSSEQPGSDLLARLKSVNSVNEELGKQIYTLSIKIDGKPAAKAPNPIRIVVDVSGLNDSQKEGLTGVFYADLNAYRQLGGELSADKKTFSFCAYDAGRYGLIYTNSIIKLQFAIGDAKYIKNGAEAVNDVAPFLSQDNRTMIPVRAVAEALGSKVDWSEETRTATITKDGRTVSIVIGEALPNGLGTAQIVNDRTFVPLRYVMEMLGANVVWDGGKQIVKIYL